VRSAESETADYADAGERQKAEGEFSTTDGHGYYLWILRLEGNSTLTESISSLFEDPQINIKDLLRQGHIIPLFALGIVRMFGGCATGQPKQASQKQATKRRCTESVHMA
jgi:hypothetical protein